MGFDVYDDDSKALLHFDPRTKFMLFVTSLIVSVNCFDLMPLLIYSVFLCAIYFLCGKRMQAVKLFAAFAFLTYLKFAMERAGTGAPVVVMIFSTLITVFLFFFPVLISLMLITKTTRINQFLAAFQAMHLPNALIIPLAVMFRFIQTVQEEWQGIRKAMAFRGISMEPAAILRAPMKTVEYILIPLLFSTISVMEELAAAALARGMDSEKKRTSCETVKLRVHDYLVMLVFLGIAGFFVYRKIAGGAA